MFLAHCYQQSAESRNNRRSKRATSGVADFGAPRAPLQVSTRRPGRLHVLRSMHPSARLNLCDCAAYALGKTPQRSRYSRAMISPGRILPRLKGENPHVIQSRVRKWDTAGDRSDVEQLRGKLSALRPTRGLDAPLLLSVIASQQMREITDRFGAAMLVGARREKLLFDVGGVQRYGLCGHIFNSHGNFPKCLSR
jgi:hypothetical protein